MSALMPQRVLVVSPDLHTRALLSDTLGRGGEQVTTAELVDDAWQKTLAGDVVVVVLDLTSPTLDEMVFLRALNFAGRAAGIPMVLLVPPEYQPPELASLTPEKPYDGWIPWPGPTQTICALVRRLREVRLRELTKPSATGSGLRRSSGSSARASSPAEPPMSVLATQSSPAIRTVLSGQLGVLDVPKLLTMLEPLQVSGELTLKDEHRRGKVFFVDGHVHHAVLAAGQADEIEGPEALFLLFHLKQGVFRFDLNEPAATRSIHGNMLSLLLEGMRQMDEAKAIVKKVQERRQPGSTAEVSAPDKRPTPPPFGTVPPVAPSPAPSAFPQAGPKPAIGRSSPVRRVPRPNPGV